MDRNNKVWLIDHGLCFHEEVKLRTVIWDFAGQMIPEELVSALKIFMENLYKPDGLQIDLAAFLNQTELTALQSRCEKLITDGIFPYPPNDRRAYPYPPI